MTTLIKTTNTRKTANKPTRADACKAVLNATRQFARVQKELNKKHAEFWRLAGKHNWNTQSFVSSVEAILEKV